MNAHELYGLLNSVPIVHSGTIFHQGIPNYFVLHKAEFRIPNKPNYVSITCSSSRDYFSLILDLTRQISLFPIMLILTVRILTLSYENINKNASESLQTPYDHYKCVAVDQNCLRTASKYVVNMRLYEFYELVSKIRKTS